MSSRERYTLGHDDAALESFGTRTASSHAAFFLPHLKPGMRILDCGCGPGSITVGLAQAVAPGEAVGIDIGSSSLEAAAALASEQGVSNVRFEEADIYDLPFPDESFDAAFSHNVLAHLTDPLAAVMEDEANSENRRSGGSPRRHFGPDSFTNLIHPE